MAALAWLVGQQRRRGSEPERPSGVSSLTTGRTPEPLNPGLHSVRSAAPLGLIQGGFNSPGVLVGPSPQPEPSCVHDDPPPPLLLPLLPRLNQDHKYSPERVSVCSCLLRCLWPSHSFMLSPLAANKVSRTHTDTFKAPKKHLCSHERRHTYIRSVRTDGLVTKIKLLRHR